MNVEKSTLRGNVIRVPFGNEIDLRGFRKVGPYFDVPGGAEAFRYECLRCDFKLITVAASDLTQDNADWLATHQDEHGPWPDRYIPAGER